MTGGPSRGALDSLAEFAATATASGREAHLSLHVADAVMARLAGGATREGRELERFFALADEGALGRVAANAAVTRLTEIDDIHRPSCVTVGALTVPVALAFAKDNGQGCLDALYVGQELALRLAMAAGGARLLARGQWPSLIVAPFGAAAITGRLLGLTPDRMRNALALAIAQVTRAPGGPVSGRTGRWLLFGQAVRNGCVAALAAADGMAGDAGVLSDAWLQGIGGELAAPGKLMESASLTDGLSIKHHASAKQALAAVYGLQQLIAQKSLSPESISSIELHVPPPYAVMLNREPPQNSRLASLVNAPWQLALAAFRPELLDDVAREHWPEDARLQEFAARVRVLPDPALDPLFPTAFPARLVVHCGETRHELLVTDSPGDPALKYDQSMLLDKASRMLGASGDLDTVRAALRLPSDSSALATLRTSFGYAGGRWSQVLPN